MNILFVSSLKESKCLLDCFELFLERRHTVFSVFQISLGK